MKPRYLMFLALLPFSQAAVAQPILNKLFDYSPGDSYVFRKLQSGIQIDTATIPAQGTNLTWNLSNLVFDATVQTNTVISYAASSRPAGFPGCTYVFQEYSGLQQYYRKSGDTVYYMGNDNAGGTHTFAPNPPTIGLPATWAASGDNNFAPFNTDVPGFGTWTYRGRYNAWGTLQLPGGISIPNTGLYIVNGGTAAMSYTDYMWARAGEKDPVLRIQFRHQGSSTAIQYAYVTVAALAVPGSAGAVSLSLSPNPVQHHLRILAGSVLETISVSDLNGRLLLQQTATGQEETVNLASLQPGMYTVRITLQNGQTAVRKVVKK